MPSGGGWVSLGELRVLRALGLVQFWQYACMHACMLLAYACFMMHASPNQEKEKRKGICHIYVETAPRNAVAFLVALCGVPGHWRVHTEVARAKSC
jgi:hypothetical protein